MRPKAELAFPKATVVEDAKLLKSMRGPCQSCGKRGEFPVHHIVRRSHQRLDVPENLIPLCHECHRNVHDHKTEEGLLVIKVKTKEELRRLKQLAPGAGIWKVRVPR